MNVEFDGIVRIAGVPIMTYTGGKEMGLNFIMTVEDAVELRDRLTVEIQTAQSHGMA